MVEREHEPTTDRPRPRPSVVEAPATAAAAPEPAAPEPAAPEPAAPEPAAPEPAAPEPAAPEPAAPEPAAPEPAAPEPAAPEPAAPEPAAPVARTYRARNRWSLVAALVVTTAVVVAVVLIVVHGRSGGSGSGPAENAADQNSAIITDPGAANAFLAGATTDIVAVTTYDYRSLDTALSNGEPVTTGDYRTSFRAALTGPLAAEARRLHRVQTFALLAAGIGEMSDGGTSAKVLIFGAQSVTDDTTGGKVRQTLVTLTATILRRTNRYLVADLVAGQNAGLPAGTAGLRAAAEAGRSEVTAVLSLRHDHFDADYNAALTGAVEPLRTMLTSQSAAARARIVKGGYDLAGSVSAVAVQRADDDTLVLLVAATGTRTSNGKTTVVVDGRYRVTVVHLSGRWVTSSVAAVTPG